LTILAIGEDDGAAKLKRPHNAVQVSCTFRLEGH